MGIEELAAGSDVDHVHRNAVLMSKYRQMLDIKQQINQDVMYTRLFNSQ